MAVVPFNTYNQATELLASQGTIGTYGDLALALENNPGWRVIDGAKQITNPVVTGADKVVPITNYIKTAPELEGGVVGATEVVEMTEAAGTGEVVAASSGLATAWSVATVVTAVLQGVGLGIKAYELTPEFWTGVSNKLFGTEIAYEDIKGYKITGTIKEELFGTEEQNTTYVPYETVLSILEYCSDFGLFDVTVESEYYENWTPNTTPTIHHYGTNLADAFKATLQAFTKINGTHMSNPAVAACVANAPAWFNSLNLTGNYVVITWDSGWSGNYLYTQNVRVCCMNGPLNILVNCNSNNTYSLPDGTVYKGQNLSNNQYPSGMQYELSCSQDGVPHYSSGSRSMGYFLSGFKITSYNWTTWKQIQYSNVNCDYETSPAPQVYELPDNPTLYDPTQPFAQQYPDWLARLINTNGLKLPYDDPSLYPIPWLPITMPDYDPMTQPEKYPDPATSPDPSPYPAQEPQPWAQRGRLPWQIPEPYPDPNPDPGDVKDPRTGDDDPTDDNPPVDPTPTPPIVFPTIGGEANAIFTVYKPVLSELNSLAGVLWTSNFLENLMKVFTNNPMDAVISLHMLYATPHVGGRQNIKLGCYDSGVASDVVDKQYLQIDCGTVRIPEYFGDVRDYVNSSVDVYLPFVGMRHLKTQDIVGSYVTIKAGVDVFTGTILYTINIRKSSGINQVMYAFEGNCAVQLPLTGADKSRMFSVLGAAATGAAIGGPVGAGVGAFTAAMNGAMQADVQRSGNFGSNAGAMGVKKPYIVVSRNLGYDAERYSRYHGYPANKTVQLSNCVGYTRVLDCRVDGISGATDREKNMILDALKRGVVI